MVFVRGPRILRTLSRKLGARLFALLSAVLLLILVALGYLNLRLHRHDLEQSTLSAGERVSDIIRRSTSYHMMRNDRAALDHVIQTMRQEPGIVRVRITNHEGRVSFSTDPREINRIVGAKELDCSDCFSATRSDGVQSRFRIFEEGEERVLGVVTPILNTPTCATAECHAHPIEQRVLGVLDTNLSLADADANLAASSRQMLMYSIMAVLAISLVSGVFVFAFVHRPVRSLLDGTEQLRRGELGYQIQVHSDDELGELGTSFNEMSWQLAEAQEELKAWALELEARVDAKTEELRRAHDQMLQAEKLTSLGKLAAVVAHEINNPLSAIVTYAKLLRKWMDRDKDELEGHMDEIRESLALIASESRRCGDLVRSLLTFARVPPMNTGEIQLNDVIRQALKLVEHKLELANISAHVELNSALPAVHGDSAQLEQLFLALMMNAIDAVGREGNIFVESSTTAKGQVLVEIRDDGCGIEPEILPRIFDPFLTTKEAGVGLGLAISKTIVERHGGEINVTSEAGRGATFSVVLPVFVKKSEKAPELAAV